MLKKTVLVRALSIAFSGAAMTAAIVPAAMAQSNAAGNIFGQVESPAGATIVLLNTGTGARRTVTPDASGRYTATAMPPGHYKVDLVRDGATVKSTEVDVIIGQGADASFVAAPADNIQAVQVTGRRSRIDVSSTNNGASFTARELEKLPIATNIDAIIQLAPNTTRADSRYAAGASFGGGGASENAYYINGFPVTNPLTQLGGSELPFGAIAQAQILTGGFGAEFGRSVGGVVNVTTKSGTNNWEFGASTSIEPNSMRAQEKDIYYSNTGANPATDGTLYRRNSGNNLTKKTLGAYLGGPLIKDKLFMFAAIEEKKNDSGGVNSVSTGGNSIGYIGSATLDKTGWEERQDKSTRYLTKFDWNITDNHRLEATFIGDDNQEDRQLYGYNYATASRGATQYSSEHYENQSNFTPVGAESQILRYTGNLTDDLTLTALYGRSKTKVVNTYGGDLGNLYQITTTAAGRVPGLDYSTDQVLSGTIVPDGSQNKTTSMRMDLEYKLGTHLLRAGFDNNKLKSINAGDVNAGGGIWYYDRNTSQSAVSLNGTKVVIPGHGGYSDQGYFVSERLFNTATNAYSDQTAQYLEDRYQITPNLLITGGIRHEGFKNKNGVGATFLEVKDQWSPRLSASWDVYGDASLKVYGSAGRYSLQIPTHLAVRGASQSLNTRQYFSYTGIDENGYPTGLVPLTGVTSTNNEFYQVKDVSTLTALNIKPTYQDEITLGFEKAFSPSLNFGAKITYRELKNTIDDYCDDRAVLAWADRNGVDTTNFGGLGCVTFNPGKDNTFLVDFAGTGSNYTTVHLTKAELGFDDPKRTYTAVDLFAEHPLRSGWYGRVNYTWSRSRGNTEGQTRSDNAQTDVAATSTWDTVELMQNANGLLPNDREHQVKAFGFYELTPQWTLGGNFLAASGRPRNCFGNQPNLADDAPDYGSVYFWCGDKAAPRGSYGNLPWDIRLDLNVAYRPAIVKGLALKVDVFNVANRQTVQNVEETYNLTGTTINPTYGRVISYTEPRSIKLTAEYNYKF
jgi:hypothetical protein